MIKGTNNMMYEFVSDDANEVAKVANALHELFDMLLTAEFIQKKDEKEVEKDD